MGGLFGGGGGGKSKQQSAGPDPNMEMMMMMSQMQAQQAAAQAKAAEKAQREAMLESQKQSALASARQGETSAQRLLSQTGTVQQAKDIAAAKEQKQAYEAAGQSAIGGGYDLSKSQQEQSANLAGTGVKKIGMPFYGVTDTANEGVASGQSANIFNLPKTTGIKFGGQ